MGGRKRTNPHLSSLRGHTGPNGRTTASLHAGGRFAHDRRRTGPTAAQRLHTAWREAIQWASSGQPRTDPETAVLARSEREVDRPVLGPGEDTGGRKGEDKVRVTSSWLP